MTTTMNRLPVSTWNPLGVNYAPASAALPAVPAAGWAKAEALSPALPAGVTAPAAADFGSFAASGMGAETDAWLAANANLVNHLAVTGTADAPVVFETALDADHPHALTYLTIDAAAGSSLTVVQVVRGDAEGGVSANLTRIRAAEGAHVVLVQVQLLGNRARRWNAVAIEQGTSARVPPTAARKASTVPSPPSATGMAQISASGSSRNISSDAMRQMSSEDSVPLKESGISTYFAMVSAPFRKSEPRRLPRLTGLLLTACRTALPSGPSHPPCSCTASRSRCSCPPSCTPAAHTWGYPVPWR